ncbi:hypothetical protein PENSPDRAFT_748079 [Peniophora sp. CONT]|nr:hypothetical protein PENSPDRAFT_748079 [Peniophora sp. CONT]
MEPPSSGWASTTMTLSVAKRLAFPTRTKSSWMMFSAGSLRARGSLRANEVALDFALGMPAQFVPAHVLPNEKIDQLATGISNRLVLTSSDLGGDLHTLFLTSDGRVYACGRADAAALGLPKDHEALADGAGFVNEPVRVPFRDQEDNDPAVHISAGTTYSAAVTEDGALYAWGEGSQSELDQGGK